jgi:allantoate deiminase
MQHRATPCSDELNELLGRSVKTVQKTCPWLVSGAGHDAVVIAELAPVAMLFVRSREGLSHHPDEYTSPADLEIALRVVVDFLTRMARLS